MDFKRTEKGYRNLTRWTRSRRNATKDTDSGISSASSCDVVDTTEFRPNITSTIKGKTFAESTNNKFLPIVLLKRSKEAEKLLQQEKHVYLQSLELCGQSKVQPTNSNNTTGKDLIHSQNFKEPNDVDAMDDDSPVNSESAVTNAKYNLRKLDKCNIPKRFRDISPTSNKRNKPYDPLIRKEPIYNIKIVKQIYGETTEKSTISLIPLVPDQQTTKNKLKRQRKKKRNGIRVSSVKTKKTTTTSRHRKVWKRSNDVPHDFDCITSDHIIFRGALLEKSPYKFLISGKVNIQRTPPSSDSENVSLRNETLENTPLRNILEKTPESHKSPSATITPQQVIRTNFIPEFAQTPNSKIIRTTHNCSLQDTSVSNNKNLKIKDTLNDNTEIHCNNMAFANDSESQLQEVDELSGYTCNKLGSRLRRFNLGKVRKDMDKPISRARKRNSSLSDDVVFSKRTKKLHDTRNTEQEKESGDVAVTLNKLSNTPAVHVNNNIPEKFEMLKKYSSSPPKLPYITPLTTSNVDSTSKILEKHSTETLTISPKQLFNSSEVRVNSFIKPIESPNNSDIHCDNPNNSPFDLRHRLNRQRSIFKTPLLPLIKRPPTRVTPEILSKLNRSITPTVERNNINQDFDAISLFAESIHEVVNPKNLKSSHEHFEVNKNLSPETSMILYPEDARERQESPTPHVPAVMVHKVDGKCNESKEKSLSSFNVDSKCNESSSVNVPIVNFPEVTTISDKLSIESKVPMLHKSLSELVKFNDICKPMVQSIQEADSSLVESPSSETTSVDNKDTAKVTEWIASTSNETLIIPTEKVDNLLRKFCRHYQRRGTCNYHKVRGQCNFHHTAPIHLKQMIKKLTHNQFWYLYKNVVNNKRYLFTELFDEFVDYMKDQETALLDIVKDVRHVISFEKKRYVKMVISALNNFGFPFHIAVEEIFIAHSTERWLVEILFDIVESDLNCLENNWCLVQKIIDFLQHNIDQGIISDIFTKCINAYPPHKVFCENIYVNLIKTGILDVSREPQNKIIKYIDLLKCFHLFEYAKHIEDKCNIHLNKELINATSKVFADDNENDNKEQEEQEDVNEIAVTEPTFSSSLNESENYLEVEDESVTSMKKQTNLYTNFFNGVNVNSNVNRNNFDPYISVAHEQSVAEYVPTQPFTLFNSYSQNYSFGNQGFVQENSEEGTNPDQINNSLIGLVKNVPSNASNRAPTIKDVEPESSQNWLCNKSNSSSAGETENTVNDISNEDIINLSDALKQRDISRILSLFRKHSSPASSKSFVIHIVVALREFKSSSMVEFIIKNIFSNFEKLCNTMPTNLTRLLQLFGLNILPYLDSYKKYEVANVILNKFPNNYSDFLTTECVVNFEYLSTSNYRYLFIFKILTRNANFRKAMMYLKSLDLSGNDNLFSDENSPKFLEYKKRLICEFMDNGLKKDIPAVKEMLCFLTLEIKSCRCIDTEKYLNYLIINMLNNYSEQKLELIGILQIILSSWYKYLWKDVLRALFIQLYNELSDFKILELYQINVRSKIYQAPEGRANSITIPSNLLKEEIYVMLHLYFHSLSKNNCPVNNIIIEIDPELQEEPEKVCLSILINSRTDTTVVKNRILNILNKLPYPPKNFIDYEQSILLRFEDIQLLLNYYKSDTLPPLQKTF